jgi:hypothetical protein
MTLFRIVRMPLVVAAVALVAVLAGCSVDSIFMVSGRQAASALTLVDPSNPANTVTQVDFDLYGGQHIPVGSVSIGVTAESLVVTYSTTDGWTLAEAHLWVGDSSTGYPQTRTGNPQIGRFPYKAEDIDGTSYSFVIPFASLGIDADQTECAASTFSMLAHAVVEKIVDGEVVQEETAWAGTERLLDRGTWATIVSFTLTCIGNPEPPNGSGETAWAYDPENSETFSELTISNNWGWVNGPYVNDGGVHSYVMQLWAGAAQSDLNKGTEVGTVTLHISDGAIAVEFALFAGYTLGEVQAYIGSDLPDTAAPGQLGLQATGLGGASSATLSVTSNDLIPLNIYVAAHAVVFGVQND